MTAASLTLDGYRPGALAGVVALHVQYYAPAWGFGRPFEAKVAAELGEFLDRLDPARDLFLTAWDPEGRLVGSVTIDGLAGAGQGAHLRWFIASDAARGTGLGKRLMAEAMAFVDACGYRRTYLTTFQGLDAARSLYERHGFVLAREEAADPWSGGAGSVGLQLFERVAG